jgi:Rho GDP-dissociation inhibitor
VYGLKFCNLVRKKGFIVDKSEEVIGSYAPTVEIHTFDLPVEEAPSGFFMRGKYTGKAMIVD